MGFLDRLGGGGSGVRDLPPEKEPEPSTSAPLHSILPDATAAAAFNATSNERLYDPYDGLSSAIGTKKHAFTLPERVEFVFEEEAAVRRRGWTENLQFYTGLGYIGGASTGVVAGAYKFLGNFSEISKEPLKLKTNRLLNSAGALARPLGNSCGILGLFFAGSESYLANQLDNRVPDSVVSMLAGALSGAVYRSPRGPRQAAVAAGLGLIAGGGLASMRSIFPSL